jgi:hypothetical protein
MLGDALHPYGDDVDLRIDPDYVEAVEAYDRVTREELDREHAQCLSYHVNCSLAPSVDIYAAAEAHAKQSAKALIAEGDALCDSDATACWRKFAAEHVVTLWDPPYYVTEEQVQVRWMVAFWTTLAHPEAA